MHPPLRVPFSIARGFHSSCVRSQLQLAHQVFHPTRSTSAEPKCNPIIFIHGLFGSKANNRSMSKVLSNQLNTTVITLDLRNHGDSSHHPDHTYAAMADDVESFIRTSEFHKPVLIGHSMGAKTAMAVALRSPDLVSALIPVDNGPGRAALDKGFPKDVAGFPKYVEGMREIDQAGVTKQSDADVILQKYEQNLGIRQFLLTNLIRSKEDNTLKSRIPLDILGGALRGMADFPYTASDDVKFEGPTLFIRGTKSFYVNDKVLPLISHFFPNYRMVDVEAGHWLISENPEAFKNAVVDFLSSERPS